MFGLFWQSEVRNFHKRASLDGEARRTKRSKARGLHPTHKRVLISPHNTRLHRGLELKSVKCQKLEWAATVSNLKFLKWSLVISIRHQKAEVEQMGLLWV